MSKTSRSLLTTFLVAIAGFALAAPLAAQVTETPPDTAAVEVPAPPDSLSVEPPTAGIADTMPQAAADDAPPAVGDAAAATNDAAPPVEAAPSHDWEFALSASQRVPGASGTVQVTEGETDNGFAVLAQGLPPVDDLDEEGRDIAVFQVWVVPSKDRVAESTLAGTMTLAPNGGGRFEGRTALDTFGVIVMASPEGETRLSGIPVLTGIPVTQAPPPSIQTEAPAAQAEPEVAAPAESEPEPAAEAPAPESEPETESPAPQTEAGQP